MALLISIHKILIWSKSCYTAIVLQPFIQWPTATFCITPKIMVVNCNAQMYRSGGSEITSLSSSEDRPVKQLFFILLMATSLPLHFPWYTVPNVPEPSSLSSSRSSFLMICGKLLCLVLQQDHKEINQIS